MDRARPTPSAPQEDHPPAASCSQGHSDAQSGPKIDGTRKEWILLHRLEQVCKQAQRGTNV